MQTVYLWHERHSLIMAICMQRIFEYALEKKNWRSAIFCHPDMTINWQSGWHFLIVKHEFLALAVTACSVMTTQSLLYLYFISDQP